MKLEWENVGTTGCKAGAFDIVNKFGYCTVYIAGRPILDLNGEEPAKAFCQEIVESFPDKDESPWIKTSERMPTEKDGTHVFFARAKYFTICSVNTINKDDTHWMPIPELPKEDSFEKTWDACHEELHNLFENKSAFYSKLKVSMKLAYEQGVRDEFKKSQNK